MAKYAAPGILTFKQARKAFREGRDSALAELETTSAVATKSSSTKVTRTNPTDSRASRWNIRSLSTQYSPYEFEQIVEELFRADGYRVTRTSKSGDAGLDVLAQRSGRYVGIQAKCYSSGNKVGSPEVQNAVGAAIQEGCDEVVLVTTSDFTSPAISAASETTLNGIRVTLINGEQLVRRLNK